MGRGGKRGGGLADVIGGKRGKTCTRRQAREKAKAENSLTPSNHVCMVLEQLGLIAGRHFHIKLRLLRGRCTSFGNFNYF